MEKIIWQYWETKEGSRKPPFIDGLYEIAKKNSGIKVIRVGPENLIEYLPDLPDHILQIEELAHKADMIRAMLLAQYGGMWLDSDAIVMKNLEWMFNYLEEYDFIGFNDTGTISAEDTNVRVNCILSRPSGIVISEWVKQQHAKFPQVEYQWTEVGTDLLGPICVNNSKSIKIMPFDIVSPIKWDSIARFDSIFEDSKPFFEKTYIVMLSAAILRDNDSSLLRETLKEISQSGTLLGDFINYALDQEYSPPPLYLKTLLNIRYRILSLINSFIKS